MGKMPANENVFPIKTYEFQILEVGVVVLELSQYANKQIFMELPKTFN